MLRTVSAFALCSHAAAFTHLVPTPSMSAHRTMHSADAVRVPTPANMVASVPLRLATVAAPLSLGMRSVSILAAVAAVLLGWMFRVLNTPSRVYDRAVNTVGREY